ncbi:hypothetical protein LMG31506_00233 [Cupriavidus yeoncheonensis]|uniref:Uncharacterized protein n=1 Tax=Cupriavidus yeoncheonensis TaxID=1462994 RepID=A0A916IN14_9BURK|nr:hypothetical protein [Cupriavidus yeoncheonensis]CAG2126909.1 hypothetical protein LMG31506_00233 [Cupriavidus yeoncheonensis]
MALSAFQRLSDRILARLGEDAVLRNTVPCRVNIEFNVEVVGTDGQMSFARAVATCQRSLRPQRNESLALVDAAGVPIPDQAYLIDSPAFEDNGYTARYVLRRA